MKFFSYRLGAIAILAFASMFLVQCRKDINEHVELISDNSDTGNRSESTSNAEVYAAGNSFDGANTGGGDVWINGVPTRFVSGLNYGISSIYVDGEDQYIAGYRAGARFEAVLWKNGVAQELSDGVNNSLATSVFVSGNDVYVAGSQSHENPPYSPTYVATIWKNGVATELTSVFTASGASSIFVSGNDVYVGGSIRGTNSWEIPTVWKNGVPTSYPTNNGNSSSISSIFIDGNDIYAAGFAYHNNDISNIQTAVLWKNGVYNALSNGRTDVVASSVYVSEGNVYVVGNERPKKKKINNMGKLWINGHVTNLSPSNLNSMATAVSACGTDVYVAGWKDRVINGLPSTQAVIWKNKIPNWLETPNAIGSGAYALFVKCNN